MVFFTTLFFLGFSILALICKEFTGLEIAQLVIRQSDLFGHEGTYVRVVLQDSTATCSLGVGVELHHHSQVLQRVLLEHSAINLEAAIV